MGEAAQKQDMLELLGERLGPVMRNGIHDHGCPKCGVEQQGAISKQWHAGFDRRDQADLCRVPGEHLHGRCQACGFQWLEQVRDAEADERRTPAADVGATMHRSTLTLLGKAGEA